MMLAEMMKYTQVADELIIGTILKNERVPEKAIYLFNHVLNAQHVWASRVLGRASMYGVWEEHSPETFFSISVANSEFFKLILESTDLNKEITYTNNSGETFTNLVKDILLHVINHSTHHRAQIASLLKAEGISPPITDYIILKREMQL